MTWDRAIRKNLDLPPPRTRVQPYVLKNPSPGLVKALEGREIPIHGNGKIMNAVVANGPLDVWGDNSQWPPSVEAVKKENARINQIAGKDISKKTKTYKLNEWNKILKPGYRKFIQHEQYYLRNHVRTHPHAEMYRVLALAQIRKDTHELDEEKVKEISTISAHAKLAEDAFAKLNARFAPKTKSASE